MSRFDQAYFDVNYRHYLRQNPRRKMRFYEELVRAHLPARSGPHRILEVGCGFGPFLRHLGPEWEKFGMDRSEYALRQAAAGIPGAAFAVGDAALLPVRGPFDAIVSFDVIEHVSDLEHLACEVRCAMAPDGVFVFAVPVYDGPLGPVVHLLDKDPTHTHKESRTFWVAWARRHFEIVDTFGMFRYLVPYGPFIHMHARMAFAVAPAIALCCRRK